MAHQKRGTGDKATLVLGQNHNVMILSGQFRGKNFPPFMNK